MTTKQRNKREGECGACGQIVRRGEGLTITSGHNGYTIRHTLCRKCAHGGPTRTGDLR